MRLKENKILPWLAVAAVAVVAAFVLSEQGRRWLCACGRLLVWVGDAWASDTSQHLLDPYSLTHVLHGFLFYWLLVWAAPRLPFAWRLFFAVSLEAVWEVVENSEFVIRRYREATAALGYYGDTVVNSLGDLLACAVGFALASRLGLRRSLLVFLLTEAVLLASIRDSLILNIVMLLYPLEEVRAWQAAGH